MKQTAKTVDSRFQLARGESWHRGARVRKQAPKATQRKRR